MKKDERRRLKLSKFERWLVGGMMFTNGECPYCHEPFAKPKKNDKYTLLFDVYNFILHYRKEHKREKEGRSVLYRGG